ncbi:MAG: QueT transporter family protein [Oscillospiraceae bacterium]
MKKISAKALARCGVIAALYVVISVLLLPITFGMMQVRVSEALTLLPVLSPLGVWGVTIGCLLTNAYGVAAGANILGAADLLFGTAATLAAALATRGLRRIRCCGLPVASALPPILINAAVIGAELTFAETGRIGHPILAANMAWVGLGQLLACGGLGLLLIWALERVGLDQRLFGAD